MATPVHREELSLAHLVRALAGDESEPPKHSLQRGGSRVFVIR